MTPQIVRALEVIRPGAEYALHGDTYAGLNWVDTVQTKPTEPELAAAVAALPPEKNIVPMDVFIGRWTDPEYTLLKQKHAQAVQTGNNINLVKMWDRGMARGSVDLNTQASRDFQAALVNASILTQARADVIFS